MPAALPETPTPDLLKTQLLYNGNNGNSQVLQNGAMPLFSPESLAYTSMAAEHWRNSWKDRQYAEAGPAEGVSRGQASVPTPLLAMQNSFVRMRAIVFKQEQATRKVSFGFWVTILLMICMVAGLGAYIFYSYLPNASENAAHTSQPAAGQSPTLRIAGAPSTTVKIGQKLQIAGSNFGPHDAINFLLDATTPITGADGKPLGAQADAQGTFEVTIPITHDWPIGAHSIQAVDSAARQSSYLNIQIIPGAKPVTNSPNLSIMLNGQPIKLLSFAKQVGQPDPAAQRITITNTSAAVLNWTATVTTSWLSIEDNNNLGQLAVSQPLSIGIGVDTSGLGTSPPNQPYRGQVLFTINNNEVLTLPVQLQIKDAKPELTFSPNPIVVVSRPDGSCQPGASLTLINLGTTVQNWKLGVDGPTGNRLHFLINGQIITSGQLEEKLGQSLDPRRTHVYLCGNPNMIGVPQKNRETGERIFPQPSGVLEILEKRGFQMDQPSLKIKGNLHYEEYW